MKYRKLGRTNLSVSEIGFGSWGIGGGMWHGSDDSESLRSLHKAVERGINLIDTALVYGDGHSERIVGKFLTEISEPAMIATKIPPMNRRWPAQKGSKLRDVFPAEYIIECTHQSLRNLKVDTIDIQQLHVWQDNWTYVEEWIRTIEDLKSEGKIRFFGVSINNHEPENALRLIGSGQVDTVQVIYNIFDQTPEKSLFSSCIKENVGVIVRVPFDEGALTGKIEPETVFDRTDFRNRYFRGDRKKEVKIHIDSLQQLLGKEASTLPELALRFCLHHEAVSTVIPGMRVERHVGENCAVSDGRVLSAEMIESLREHQWIKDFYS